MTFLWSALMCFRFSLVCRCWEVHGQVGEQRWRSWNFRWWFDSNQLQRVGVGVGARTLCPTWMLGFWEPTSALASSGTFLRSRTKASGSSSGTGGGRTPGRCLDDEDEAGRVCSRFSCWSCSRFRRASSRLSGASYKTTAIVIKTKCLKIMS